MTHQSTISDVLLQANLQLLNYTATNGFSRRRILLESSSDSHLLELPAGTTAALSEQQGHGGAGLQRVPGAVSMLQQGGQQVARPQRHFRSALRKLLEVSLLGGPALQLLRAHQQALQNLMSMQGVAALTAQGLCSHVQVEAAGLSNVTAELQQSIRWSVHPQP